MNPFDAGVIKVLLVDDQRIIGEAIKRMIEAESDMSFRQCMEPEQALKTALEFKPVVILQDLVMPGVDGFSLVQAYKNAPELADVPVIVLSSEENVEIKLKAFSLRASDYMVKIPQRVELVGRIREHAKACLRLRDLEMALAELQAAKPAIDTLAWHDAVLYAVYSLSRNLGTPLQYVASNLMFVGDAFRSLVRFRARLAKLDISPELMAAMQAAADAEDLDFVFDDAPKALRQAHDEVARASAMLDAFKSFQLRRQAGAAPSPVDGNAAVKAVCSFLKDSLASVAELKLDLQEGLPFVPARPGDVTLALILLFSDSIAAIEARFGRQARKGTISVRSSMAENNMLKLEFSDNGETLPDNALSANLTPSGFADAQLRSGLYAVKRMVELAGGRFEARNLGDSGFQVSLFALAPSSKDASSPGN